jgi:hypothetical protein
MSPNIIRMETIIMPKTELNYSCKLCTFTCSKQSNYINHLSTRKHLANEKNAVGDIKNAYFICTACTKQYKSRNGLWKHSNRCKNSLMK